MPRYDLAVAGAGMGGLAAAALLARKGKRVVLVYPEQSPGGELRAVSDAQFIFSPGPLLSFGFERGGILQKLCSDLGILLNATVPSPVYQVALPDRRISVYSDAAETREELRREFPLEIDRIDRFYRELGRKGERYVKNRLSAFRSRHTNASSFIGSFGFSREFESFLNCAARGFLQRDAGELTMASLGSVFDGVPLAIEGGFPRLCEQLLSAILSHGGEVRHEEGGAEVIQRNGAAAGLDLDSGAAIEAGSVLLNGPASPAAYSVLFLGVPDTALPVGMARAVFALPEYGRPGEMFMLGVNSSDQLSLRTPGMRSLSVVFPFRDYPDGALSARSAAIEHIIPFLDQFLLIEKRHAPASGDYRSPAAARKKPARQQLDAAPLERSSLKNLYVLPDDARSPLNAVRAARAVEHILAR